MGSPRLDRKLLDKIAKKVSKERKSVNVMVSRKAAKLGISSEAALIILAKELGIGTSIYQRRLDPSKQAEVRDSLPSVFSPSIASKNTKAKKRGIVTERQKEKVAQKAAIEYLLEDKELRQRCADILQARSHFDRPINQATLVLEDRIRQKATPTKQLVGENLVGYAFNPELSKTVLKISDNPDEQRGFTSILRGIVPAFRNPTHHHVANRFTREEALRVCGFIDVLLRVVDNSKNTSP